MNVSGSYSSAPLRGPAPTDSVAASAGGQVPSDDASGSRVDVSSSAHELARIAKLVQQAPDVRSEKVADLKSRINAGTYKVDLNRLADRLSNLV